MAAEIVFKEDRLGPALPGHDINLYRALQRDLARPLMLATSDRAEQVRRALRTAVPRSHASEREIAQLLSTAVGTLPRRLAEQGTTFRQLLADARRELARRHLTGAQSSVTEIAEVLAEANTRT